MIAILPPIIFESALTLKLTYFFDNIASIMMFAILGTIQACLFTGAAVWLLGLVGMQVVIYGYC